MTILELFGLAPVARHILSERTSRKFLTEQPFANPDLVVGLELEIEGWPTPPGECAFTGITFTTDGSLRNNGVELITKPFASKYIPGLVDKVLTHFEVSEDNYSDRCSIHVHVNCQDLTREQLQTVFIVYQVVERMLFRFAGAERENNIFCVPWNQCAIANGFIDNFLSDTYNATANWQKYAALNVLPLRDKGTIEFRHMPGTCDVEKITTWLNLIGAMMRYATITSYDEVKATILKLNTASNYYEFISSVFGDWAKYVEVFEQELEMGVIDAKMMLSPIKKKKSAMHIDDFLAGLEARLVNTLNIPAGRFTLNDIAPVAVEGSF